MSDYLWDKTGEADTEVERLEELLGEFRHRPRALELPPDVATQAVRAPRFFRTAWLAVAAALLLAVMAVAFVALRSGRMSGTTQTASQDSPSPSRQIATPQGQSPKPVASPDLKPATQPEIHKVEVANQGSSRKGEPRRKGERVVAVKPGRELMTTGANSPQNHESVLIQTLRGGSVEESLAEVAAQRQLAKEQLVYALRLTSSKLKEVQKKTQGIVDSKPAFDERNRIR